MSCDYLNALLTDILEPAADETATPAPVLIPAQPRQPWERRRVSAEQTPPQVPDLVDNPPLDNWEVDLFDWRYGLRGSTEAEVAQAYYSIFGSDTDADDSS